MSAHIYGGSSSSSHECAYLFMGAIVAMSAYIYRGSSSHECAYLWGQQQ